MSIAAGGTDSAIAGPPAPARVVTGYWLAVLPGQGFGIVHGSGPSTGTARARFLGATQRDLQMNLHGAVNSLQSSGVNAVQIWEVADGPDKLIANAVKNGSAWATGPASVSWDTLPTKILAVVLTAALGGAAFGAATAGGEAATAGGAAATGGAAAGAEAVAGSGAAGGAAAGGAVAGAGKVAGKVAKGAAKTVAGNAGKIAGALTVAGLFTNISWWKGASMVIAGAVLFILAVRELT